MDVRRIRPVEPGRHFRLVLPLFELIEQRLFALQRTREVEQRDGVDVEGHGLALLLIERAGDLSLGLLRRFELAPRGVAPRRIGGRHRVETGLMRLFDRAAQRLHGRVFRLEQQQLLVVVTL